MFVCLTRGFNVLSDFSIIFFNVVLFFKQKIKEWNDDWRPNYFMVDFCEAEIKAILETFPGY